MAWSIECAVDSASAVLYLSAVAVAAPYLGSPVLSELLEAHRPAHLHGHGLMTQSRQQAAGRVLRRAQPGWPHASRPGPHVASLVVELQGVGP
jgi:hypothetical protein